MIVVTWIVLGLTGFFIAMLPYNLLKESKPRPATRPNVLAISSLLALAYNLFVLAVLWANLHGHLLWRR